MADAKELLEEVSNLHDNVVGHEYRLTKSPGMAANFANLVDRLFSTARHYAGLKNSDINAKYSEALRQMAHTLYSATYYLRCHECSNRRLGESIMMIESTVSTIHRTIPGFDCIEFNTYYWGCNTL